LESEQQLLTRALGEGWEKERLVAVLSKIAEDSRA